MNEKPRKLKIYHHQRDALLGMLSANPSEILHSPQARRMLALDRWEGGEHQLQASAETASGVMPGTIAHNRGEVELKVFGSVHRTTRLIGPLSGLDPVYSAAHELKALSIGPRTEMELFHLMAIGFTLNNVRAIDLVSSSPLIDAGDMHQMPYGDRAFDVVISSWVLSYSREPQRAVDEMLRVCKDGGLVAIGVTYEPGYGRGVIDTTSRDTATEIMGCMYGSSEELKALIGPRLRKVHFQQEPEDDTKPGPLMLIASIRHG